MEAMIRHTYPPSKFPSKFSKENHAESMDFEGTAILCHRKGMHGDSVSLYYSGFAEFEKLCESITPTREDCYYVSKICNKMEKYFGSEDDRRNQFNELLTGYLKVPVSQDGYGTKCDSCTLDYPALIGELKNEVGAGGCDSFTEAIAYYVCMLRTCKSWKHWAQPAFLYELVGPNLMISGIVFGTSVYVDRLNSVWLATQPNVPRAMEKTVKVFAALKHSVIKLRLFYQQIMSDAQSSAHSLVFPRYPSFQQYDTTTIQYERRLGVHLFYGTVDSKKVLVKFAHTYCADVHKLLEESGLAPRLFHVQEVDDKKVIVMEHVEGAGHIDEYLSSATQAECEGLKEQCRNALAILHDNNYVHGDFRPCNILVTPTLKVQIIDFEWSGKVEEAKYPLYMNHVDIEWPCGATDGGIITKDHDVHFLNLL